MNNYMLINWMTWKKHTFLEAYNLPRLYNEEIETLKRSLMSKENESVKDKFSQHRKAQDQMSSLVNSTRYFKEELISILLKVFQNIEEEDVRPYSFYKASIILIPKPDKNTRKGNYGPISLINIDAKNLKKYHQTKFNSILKRSYIMSKNLSLRCKDGFHKNQ